MLAILPMLAFGSCFVRGSQFSPHTPVSPSFSVPILTGTALSIALARSSRISMIFFLEYGLVLSAVPELYWRPQDWAFFERVATMKAADVPTDGVAEPRGWPRSHGMLIHSDDEYWFMTD